MILIVDDDRDVAFSLAVALEAPGRRIIVCHDAESAELVLEQERPSTVLTDVKLSGPFHFDGLELLERARAAAPNARLIAMSGSDAPGLADAVRKSGATFLAKPFQVADIEPLLRSERDSSDATELIFIPTIDDILGGTIAPKFQPIVRLDDATTFAFESLARLPYDSAVTQPETLFRYAERKRRSVDLNLLCVRRSIVRGAALARHALLFVNVDARVFNEGPRLATLIANEAAASGVPLDRIVLELTEQHPFHDSELAEQTVRLLREAGVRLAFDDVGVAYSHLPFIGRLQPSFLKISQQFGTGFHRDATRTKLVQNIVALGRDFDCAVILEGIEDGETAAAARQAGIALGQGFYFGRPAEAETLLLMSASPP